LEALFVGCIPICSPVGGIVDVLKNDYNGFLSKSPDANDFYNAVISFLESSEETIKIIRDNAIKSFDRFDISTTAGRYEELYFNLLNLKLSKT
jgi:glycosyltransferase involved in cell wall biosynthesis